jgi:hypothetical protein
VQHSPGTEIGTFPIYLNEKSLIDSLVCHFGAGLSVGRHVDMPGLTPEAKVLA